MNSLHSYVEVEGWPGGGIPNSKACRCQAGGHTWGEGDQARQQGAMEPVTAPAQLLPAWLCQNVGPEELGLPIFKTKARNPNLYEIS